MKILIIKKIKKRKINENQIKTRKEKDIIKIYHLPHLRQNLTHLPKKIILSKMIIIKEI
jgi:hypothetical protein